MRDQLMKTYSPLNANMMPGFYHFNENDESLRVVEVFVMFNPVNYHHAKAVK